MKRLFTLTCFLIALVLIESSCQKSDIVKDDGEKITVSLNLDGDFDVTVDQDPITKALTKASSNDVYAVNVTWDGGNGYYAYGLFDNIQDMTITLLAHHKYTFEVGLVKDAKNTLFYGQAFNNTYSGFCYPFQTSASGSTLLNNKFILGSGIYFTGLTNGKAHLKNMTSPSTSNATQNAGINRFYGKTIDYEPVPNGTVDVYLKRYVYGVNVIITGPNNPEGTLTVSCGNWLSATTTSSNFELGEQIHTFSSFPCESKNETISLSFTSNRGKPWNLSQSQVVTFKRNVMTTINITLNPDLSGAMFDLLEEDFDENDIDLGINTDGYIDIDVNPNN